MLAKIGKRRSDSGGRPLYEANVSGLLQRFLLVKIFAKSCACLSFGFGRSPPPTPMARDAYPEIGTWLARLAKRPGFGESCHNGMP
jgi:hypothetical protein